MLHIVNKSPFQANALESCLRLASKGSTILLIEDGVYGATQGTTWEGKVKEALADHAIYALSNDVDARGMQGKVIDGIKLVDYTGFVDLVADNANLQSWL